MDQIDEKAAGKMIWAWLPSEALLSLGIAVFFFLMGKVHWQEQWEGFSYHPDLQWYVAGSFLLAIPYLWIGKIPAIKIFKRFAFRPQIVLEIAFAALTIVYIRKFDPIKYVDDVGFILRYLDNFKNGCFFCFNPSEGPVFGLSSFIYGILGGIMTWSGLFSPESAISYLTYLGLFFTGFLYFQILRILCKQDALVWIFWIALMTLNRSMDLISNSGMESPVHYSIVLAAIYFFLRKKDAWMWFFLALAAISKLDSVPLILVVMTYWVFENKRALFPINLKHPKYLNAILFGLLPILLWIVFAKLVFGSPLPQSAFAKVYFHTHSKGSWFPFLEPFYTSAYRAPLLYVTLPIWLIQIGYVIARRSGFRDLFFGIAFIATLLLYYFYNPGERMLWYYVLPEGLLLLQMCVSFLWLGKALNAHFRILIAAIPIGFAFLFTWNFLVGERDYTRAFQNQVEEERIAMGEYLHAVVQPGDSLLSGHGLVSRWCQGLVIDQTGLNSKLATSIGRSQDLLVAALHPKWIAMHGHSWEIEKLNQFNYRLDTSFFDISTYGYPAWRIFRRDEGEKNGAHFSCLTKSEVFGEQLEEFYEPQFFTHLKAIRYTVMRPNYDPNENLLDFGLLKYDHPYSVIVRDRFPYDSIHWEKRFEIPKWEGSGTTRIVEIEVPLLREGISDTILPIERMISIDFEESYGAISMYDPIIEILKR